MNDIINTYELTDLGNSKRWTDRFADRYKYVPELKEWLYFNGFRWTLDLHGMRVRETIDILLNDIRQEAEAAAVASMESMKELGVKTIKELKAMGTPESVVALKKCKNAEDLENWLRQSQSKPKIDAMLSLASKLGASKGYAEFDSKGKYIGVQNGVINVVTGKFVHNQPEYYITKSANCPYDETATCTNWLKFLDTIFQGDAEMIAFVQRLAGEALLGERCKTKLLIFTGEGANGKSTFVDSIMLMLGDYAVTTSPDAITGGSRNTDYFLASMKGARLAVLNETRANAKLDNNMVKQLVDSGKVQTRQIYGKPFEFQPVATPILTTNNPPVISSEYAINRRILCAPFGYQIPEADRNPNFIKEMIEPELSGMLNWAIEGCREYLAQGGLNPPKSVVNATQLYIYEHDRVLKFVSENYEAATGSKIPVKTLYGDYLAWCNNFDYETYSSKQFNQELRAMGYEIKISTGNIYYAFGLKEKVHSQENVIPIDSGRNPAESPMAALISCLQM